MLLVNLLPWREQLIYETKRNTIIVFILCFAITLFVLFIYHFSLLARYSEQLRINNYYNQQLQGLDHSILQIDKVKQQKQILLDQMLWIHKLQLKNNKIPLLFSEIARIIPQNIILITVKYLDRQEISLCGYTNTNTSISLLLNNIEHSSHFSNGNLGESLISEHGKQFEVNFQIKG